MNEIEKLYSEQNLEFSIQGNLQLFGNRKLIRIVLYNLLDNAIKFSKNKPIVKIEVGSIQKEGKNIFFVKDNGVGFHSESERIIFRPFQKLEPSEGIGMGLTIVNHIIEKHNGKVWAESEIGVGSTFYFFIE